MGDYHDVTAFVQCHVDAYSVYLCVCEAIPVYIHIVEDKCNYNIRHLAPTGLVPYA